MKDSVKKLNIEGLRRKTTHVTIMDRRIERATDTQKKTGDIESFLRVISYKWDKNNV